MFWSVLGMRYQVLCQSGASRLETKYLILHILLMSTDLKMRNNTVYYAFVDEILLLVLFRPKNNYYMIDIQATRASNGIPHR